MGRAPCCSKVGLRRGPWSTKEDTILTNYIQQHGDGQWRSLPKKAGLLRCGKSCRLRWMNYLRPGIKRGDINQDEEDLIVRLHGLLGNRWSLIAGRLPGRTDNEIKNYWNTHLVKKLKIQIKDLQKPVKTKKMKNKKQNQKQKQKKVQKNDDNVKLITGTSMAANDENLNDHQKIKVYVPKPIRVSSVFSRTHSCESLGSGSTASNGAAERVADLPVDWAELFEMEDIYGAGGAGDGDDIFGCGFITPLFRHSQFLDSMCSDVNMLDKVYDEYLQLL